MKKVLKVLGFLVVIFVLLFVLFIYAPRILGFITSDIASVDETGLEFDIQRIPDSENGFFDLEKAASLLIKPASTSTISDLYSGKKWDKTVAEQLVATNTNALIAFSDAAKKNEFQNPIFYDFSKLNMETVMPSMSNWRTASQLSAIKSRVLLESGKGREAMEEAINSFKIGQMMMSSSDSLIEYLVGIAISNIGLDAIENVVKSNIDKTDLGIYSSELSKSYDTKKGLANALIFEHKMRGSEIESLTSEAIKSFMEEGKTEVLNLSKIDFNNFYYFRINKTKQLDADYTRYMIKNIEVDCKNLDSIVDPVKLTPTNPIQLHLTENVIGRILQDNVASSLREVYEKRCDIENRLTVVSDMLK